MFPSEPPEKQTQLRCQGARTRTNRDGSCCPLFCGWDAVFIPLFIVLAVGPASATYSSIVSTSARQLCLDLIHLLYGRILGQSLFFATMTKTILCLLIRHSPPPIARAPRRQQSVWLMLRVGFPFCTNFLVRTDIRLDARFKAWSTLF